MVLALHVDCHPRKTDFLVWLHTVDISPSLTPHTTLTQMTDFQVFLTKDLEGESLSPEVEGRRKQLVISVNGVLGKINSAHPSVRPRLFTPTANGGPPAVGRKPPIKLPAPTPDEVSPLFQAPPTIDTAHQGQEMYIECETQETPEDYLTFTSHSEEGEGGEGREQETYEAMANNDEPLDLYEDPGPHCMSE